VEQQLGGAAAQHEQVQSELLRRGETLRQTERTLYLLDRVLSLDAAAHEPRQLVDELMALVGDDMQAQRCSLMLRAPGREELYLAAARGLSPHIVQGVRIRVGEGVAGARGPVARAGARAGRAGGGAAPVAARSVLHHRAASSPFLSSTTATSWVW
jgi:hypothetical protein